MSNNRSFTGFAIAIAWPETYCKQPGSWYDPFTLWLGVNNNHYYRVGHAAVVLVDTDKGKCHYFDFGRYHAPFQHGRVRSAETDHDLKMKTTPVISPDNASITNFREIVSELQNNKACHGEGDLYTSYCQVDFQAAFDKAIRMRHEGPIPYGPFRIKGSNCSRFVNTVIQAGKPNLKYTFRLKYLRVLTPTPMNNVNSLDHRLIIPANPETIPFQPLQRLDKMKLDNTLMQPVRHPNIPSSAQWLSGEGAGSWFNFRIKGSTLRVKRYSPEGLIECDGIYESSSGEGLFPEQSLQITYPSDCKQVTLVGETTIIFYANNDREFLL